MAGLPQLRDDQIVLRRSSLGGLPTPCAPEGYSLRPFHPGDEADWQALYDAAFSDIADRVRQKVAHLMAEDVWMPERARFACLADRPMAAALAWDPPWDAPGAGMVHWVAVHPEHRRHGLGRTVVLDALDWMHSAGRRAAVLTTEVHRVEAIRLYLELGFEPDFAGAPDMDRRWAAARRNLNRSAQPANPDQTE
jgi:mycothiol synthase